MLLVGSAAAIEPLSAGALPEWNYLADLVLPVMLVGAWLCWLSLLDCLWQRRLGHSPIAATPVDDTDSSATNRIHVIGFQISLREWLALVASLSIVIAGFAYGMRDIRPRYTTHASPLAAGLNLPAGASDVCVLRGLRGTVAYNFAIDEAGFWQWARSFDSSIEAHGRGKEVKAIANEFVIITCSNDPTVSKCAHTIRHGWFHDDEDHGIQYAYDVDLGRAYYVGYGY
jgi:hypothetical protein